MSHSNCEGGQTLTVNSTQAQFKAMAQVEDHIIPIRLDIEHDHFRLKDTFMWNVSGETPSRMMQSERD